MERRKIWLGNCAIGEIQHKLDIVIAEPELMADYNVQEYEVDAMIDRFNNAKPGFYDLSDKEAELIYGELANAADINWDNYRHSRDIGFNNTARAFERVCNAIKPDEPLRKKDEDGVWVRLGR